MKPFARTVVTRAPRGLRVLVGRARAWLVDALASARAWRWGAVLGRVTLAALGLVLLGAIGRSALAKSILSTEASPAADAGATPTSVASVAVAVPSAASAPAPAQLETPPQPPFPVGASASKGRATPEDPVYLNQATLADLHRLPGVGPKRAEAILGLRAKLGHFRQIEDLLKVKGIGRAMLKRLHPLVRLSGVEGV